MSNPTVQIAARSSSGVVQPVQATPDGALRVSTGFAAYIRAAAFAHTLEEDGQYDKAAFQLQKAEAEIVKTHDDIFLRNNHTRSPGRSNGTPSHPTKYER